VASETLQEQRTGRAGTAAAGTGGVAWPCPKDGTERDRCAHLNDGLRAAVLLLAGEASLFSGQLRRFAFYFGPIGAKFGALSLAVAANFSARPPGPVAK
jgi:hypothetical protein